jgi:tubulin polyglutamylase TTLL5
MAAAGIDVGTLWSRIIELVLRSLLAVQDAIPSQPNCFELFGFDVLVDDAHKPWLIEVNASPALARDNPLDCVVKEALLADTLRLVAPPHFDRAVWAEMVRNGYL